MAVGYFHPLALVLVVVVAVELDQVVGVVVDQQPGGLVPGAVALGSFPEVSSRIPGTRLDA